MKKLLLALLILSAPAYGQRWQMVPSTPDISVSATSTLDVVFTEYRNNKTIGGVDWVSIKNDCADTLYFALRPPHTSKSATDYPLRLGPGESFSVEAFVASIGASNDNSSACTFTLQGKRR